MNTTDKWTRWISTITVVLVLLLAASAFVLSYNALNALAADNGVDIRLTWIFPLVVDGFITVASLSVLRNSLLGEGAIYQWFLVILFTALSIGFNIVHAPATPLAQLIGAVPPIALSLALHLLTEQIKSNVRRGVDVISETEMSEKTPTAEAPTELTPEERQSHVLALIQQQLYVNSEQVAAELGVSASTIRGDVKALADNGKVKREGRRVRALAGANHNGYGE